MKQSAQLQFLLACGLGLSSLSCSRSGSEPAIATSLNLAAARDGLTIVSAAPPENARARKRWTFDEPRPEWESLSSEQLSVLSPVERTQLDDGLRLRLTGSGFPVGGLKLEFEGLRFDDWETVVVQARTSDRFAGVTIAYNLDGQAGLPSVQRFFDSTDEAPPVFGDGSVQRYAIPLRVAGHADTPERLESVAVLFAAPRGPATVDVLAVELVPRGAAFIEDTGARNVARDGVTYHTLFAHTPATITCPLDLGPGSRLDFALTASPGESVTYRVSTEKDGERTTLFEETVDESAEWTQHSVPLGDAGGGIAQLVLEATSDQAGAVALWGAPIASRPAAVDAERRPNVIFYVIDGGDSDFMSLYEYGRPTTPFLEELAEEGVLFTRAHSNSTWTQPSTVSFMTSLHHSVLGGLQRGMHSTSVPADAVTLAEHFRRAGYQTASFTANPNAGRIIGTDRGMDLMRDTSTGHHSTSSIDLHGYFRDFRASYPGGPWWVHIQTTDVHEPNEPEEPYLGMFTTAEQRKQLDRWGSRIWQVAGNDFGSTSVVGFYDQALEKANIDREAYFGTRRDLYDETMVHQDHALKEFVEQLKQDGEWENTIFVLGSDHGHPAGTFARFGHGLLDPQPEPWQGAMFDSYATGVPMLVIWPGRIEGGRRVDEPVSMIDVMPTLLELADLNAPEIAQGQSLAPLLLGEPLELAPVILDEFRVDEATGEMIGNIEIIDGRWGASLEIGPVPTGADPARGRRAVPAGGRWGAVHPFFPEAPRLLLYDLEADRYATRAVNDEHPELVEQYASRLRELWAAHRALSTQFGDATDVELTPDQLAQLRALGYIR